MNGVRAGFLQPDTATFTVGFTLAPFCPLIAVSMVRGFLVQRPELAARIEREPSGRISVQATDRDVGDRPERRRGDVVLINKQRAGEVDPHALGLQDQDHVGEGRFGVLPGGRRAGA